MPALSFVLKHPITGIRPLLSGAGLGAQTLRGGAWLALGTLASQVFRLGRNVLLARILSPESFGAMAIVISISSMMDTFTEIGVRESVIQNPDGGRDEYLNSAFWVSLVRAFVSYAIIFVGASWVAAFYHDTDLRSLCRVALLGVVFRGLMSPKAFTALKSMDYKRWTLLQYGSSVAATVVTIGLAFVIRGVWALAIGFALELLILLVFSYILFPFVPRLQVDKQSARALLRFSRGVFGLSFLNLIYMRADIFVLGRLIPQEQLGIYTMAIYMVQVPTFLILNYQAQLLLPIFSRLQNEHARINVILKKGTTLLFCCFAPALVFLGLSGRSLLALLYGTRYIPGYWPLLIAAIVALINVANAQLTTAFYAMGRPQLHRFCLVMMAVLMLVTTYPAARYFGTTGTQLAALAAMLIGYAIQLGQARRLIGFLLPRAKMIAMAATTGGLVLLISATGNKVIPVFTPALNLLLGLAAALVTLFGTTLLFYRQLRLRVMAELTQA
jgi:lipopolysaccharide exporter